MRKMNWLAYDVWLPFFTLLRQIQCTEQLEAVSNRNVSNCCSPATRPCRESCTVVTSGHSSTQPAGGAGKLQRALGSSIYRVAACRQPSVLRIVLDCFCCVCQCSSAGSPPLSQALAINIMFGLQAAMLADLAAGQAFQFVLPAAEK